MRQQSGMNHIDIKNRNRGLVLQYIVSGGQLSRIDIAKRIGLTKMTVTNIVNELIRDGIIEERETAETPFVGRNPILLDVTADAPCVIGLYIARGHVSVIVTDFKLRLRYHKRTLLQEETADTLMDKLYDLTDGALRFIKGKTPHAVPLGIGAASIGPLDAASGVILNPTNFFGIRDLPVADRLASRYGLPVVLENDMNAAALAEKLYGEARPYDNFIYMGITNGIGSGIITNGRLYQGTSGFVGEIGHMSIRYDGLLCDCGNRGCLELYANMPVIVRRLREVTGEEGLTPRDFERLSGRDDCNAILEDMTDKLSTALVGTVNMLDPECIIIGHEGVFLPDKYIGRIQKQLQSRILSAGHRSIRVIKSSFGEQAPLNGSACLILQKLFEGQIYKEDVQHV